MMPRSEPEQRILDSPLAPAVHLSQCASGWSPVPQPVAQLQPAPRIQWPAFQARNPTVGKQLADRVQGSFARTPVPVRVGAIGELAYRRHQ